MLATIAPRWPRAFTAVGFGAASILVFFLVYSPHQWNDLLDEIELEAEALYLELVEIEEELSKLARGESSDLDVEIRSLRSRIGQHREANDRIKLLLEDQRDSVYFRLTTLNFEGLGDTSRLIVGAFILFVAYVLGQLGILLGRTVSLFPLAEAREIDRIGRIARSGNDILLDELERYRSNVDLLCGIVALCLSGLISSLAAAAAFGILLFWKILLGVVLSLQAIYICRTVTEYLGRRLDVLTLAVTEVSISGGAEKKEVPLTDAR